jgi:hypothetical protein
MSQKDKPLQRLNQIWRRRPILNVTALLIFALEKEPLNGLPTLGCLPRRPHWPVVPTRCRLVHHPGNELNHVISRTDGLQLFFLAASQVQIFVVVHYPVARFILFVHCKSCLSQ